MVKFSAFKFQAIRSENEQNSHHSNDPEKKRPNSASRKSVTPNAMAPVPTPKLPSPESSPLPEASPRKQALSWQQRSNGGQSHSVLSGSETSVKSALSQKLRNQKSGQLKNEDTFGAGIQTDSVSIHGDMNKNSFEQMLGIGGKLSTIGYAPNTGGRSKDDKEFEAENEAMETDTEREAKTVHKEKSEIDLTGAQTPGYEMETDLVPKSHVRKIDFDDVVGNKSVSKLDSSSCQPVPIATRSENGSEVKQTDSNVASGTVVAGSSEILSKSAGYLNFQQLIKDSNESQLNLNKSMGFLEKSTTAVRSAFVPVQSISRKDNTTGNQSVAMAIPVIIPSAVSSQSVAATCVLPATAILSSDQKTELGVCSAGSTVMNVQNQAKESINVVTVTSVLSKIPSNDIVVSSTQNSQALARQTRSKFTPIRPKASPTKASSAKDSKVESNQSYDKDKRPVAAILKEKRAKEQADAMAKLQAANFIQLKPNISLPAGQFNPLQGGHSAVNSAPQEVVIIVNNQPFMASSAGTRVSTATEAGSNTLLSSEGGDERTRSSDSETGGHHPNKGKTVTFVTESSKVTDESDKNILNTEYTPMEEEERDITPILEQRDSSPEMDLTENSKERQIHLRYPTGDKVMEAFDENVEPEKDEFMLTETPSKIAKLNINSPFRPESACSLGRETPVKITKSESSQSRPESACSYGRETPSGARKRKSSESQVRRDIKRLNSTGEEIDECPNLASVLSPENDGTNVRRTRSCTYELEKGCKQRSGHIQPQAYQQQQQPLLSSQQYQSKSAQSKKSDVAMLQGLQSPDINCLEQEALIESFPNSLLAMKPGRSNRTQSSSVGVNARSQSQQKLKSQQQDLDQRVRNFLETKAEMESNDTIKGQDVQTGICNTSMTQFSQLSPGNRTRSKTETNSLVVSDRGKPYIRPASVVTVSHSSKLDTEPSGLPSDVADWINEAIEKRQKENQSEPDLHQNQSTIKDQPKKFQFMFDSSLMQAENVKPSVFGRNGGKAQSESKRPASIGNKDEDMFTVPKAPPISANQRHKDQMARLNADHLPNNQRCQSLPIFASPSQSPVSPLPSPMSGNHGYQRALSMSPRGQAMEVNTDIVSPSGPTLSPGFHSQAPRKDLSDYRNQSPVFNPMIGNQSRDSQAMKPVGGTSYLKSIQQSLQKPMDQRPRQTPPNQRDSNQDKHHMTLPVGQGHFQGQTSLQLNNGQNPCLQSRESSLEIEERYVSQTPFSDSGYQSSGPSPILNSTPVSTFDSTEAVNMPMKNTVAESPINNFTSPIPNVSPNIRSPVRHHLTTQQTFGAMATNQIASQNFSVNSSVLRSSIHSAFIPIQGSHQDVRYVAPIKPTVTLPNTVNTDQTVQNSTNLFIDTNEPMMSSDITVGSPRSGEPPSYEMALKQLHRSGNNFDTSQVAVHSSMNTDTDMNLVRSQVQQSHPLLGGMGKENPDSEQNVLGPYAAKLKKLSQQTQIAENSKDMFLDLLSQKSESVSMSTDLSYNYLRHSELPDLPSNLNIDQSLAIHQNDTKGVNENTSHLDNLGGESSLLFNTCVNSDQSCNSQNVLDTESTKEYSQTSYPLGNPSSDSLLNIDPSFHLSPQSGSTSQNQDNCVMSSLNHLNDSDNLLMVDSQEDNQLSLADNAEFLKDIGITLEEIEGQYFNGEVDGQELEQLDIFKYENSV